MGDMGDNEIENKPEPSLASEPENATKPKSGWRGILSRPLWRKKPKLNKGTPKANTSDNAGRPIRSRPMRILLELASVAISLPILWLAALGILMNRTSIDLAFVKPHYEHWFSQAFDGKTTDIEAYSARWIEDQRVFEIHAHNVHISGQNGDVQTIKDVRGEFQIKPGAWVRPQLVGLSVTGGALTFSRTEDGSFELSMGTPKSSQDIGAVSGSKDSNMGGEVLGSLRHVRIQDSDVYMSDARTGLAVVWSDLHGTALLAQHAVKINAVGSLEQDYMDVEYVRGGKGAPFTLDLSLDLKSKNMAFGLAANNVNLATALRHLKPTPKGTEQSWEREIIGKFANLNAPMDLTASFETDAQKADLTSSSGMDS